VAGADAVKQRRRDWLGHKINAAEPGNCGSSGGRLMLCYPKVGWHSDYGDKLIDIDFEEISGILGQAAKDDSGNTFWTEGRTVKCQQVLFAHVALNASNDAIRLYLRHLLGDSAHHYMPSITEMHRRGGQLLPIIVLQNLDRSSRSHIGDDRVRGSKIDADRYQCSFLSSARLHLGHDSAHISSQGKGRAWKIVALIESDILHQAEMKRAP
jgi:hypothetical protein